jgi:hypothetical protein
VPPGLELDRLGPDEGYALFTFLSYRHGHFGPRLLGPLRRLLPSPIHTNWRIHVRDPQTGQRGITFVTNAIDSTPHALAARWLSEGMPMHVIQHAELDRTETGAYRLRLEPGPGSAPDAEALLRPASAPPDPIPDPWGICFSDYQAVLAYCVPQDRALSSQPWHGHVTRQEIHLGIPLESCQPLEGEVRSRAARALAGDAQPLCFRVAEVAFLFDRVEHDPRDPAR